jgi:hypothetical protein
LKQYFIALGAFRAWGRSKSGAKDARAPRHSNQVCEQRLGKQNVKKPFGFNFPGATSYKGHDFYLPKKKIKKDFCCDRDP